MSSHPRTSGLDLLWLVPLSVVAVLGSFWTNVPGNRVSEAGSDPWVAAALGLGAVLGLWGSLRWPLRGAVVTFGAVTLFVVADVRDGPVYLTLAASAYLVSERVRVRQGARVVAAGTLVVCAALVVRAVADFDNERSLWQLFAILAVVAAGAALGTLVRTRALAAQERVRAVAAQEQLHMAQELHDSVGHGLAVIAMQAGVGLHVLELDPAAARTALVAIRDSARESLDALRTELAQLAGDPAPRRPRHGVADLDQLVARVRGAGPRVELSGSPGELPEAVDAVAYSVVQEALTNVLRHAGAASVAVRLDRSEDRLTVTVEDDGSGGHGHDEGMGLRAMRERVQGLGGSFSAGTRPSGGFAVQAGLPL